MRQVKFISLLVMLAVLLSGCAGNPQKRVALGQDFYENKTGTIGVYMHELPKPEVNIYGAGCLLCYAAASAATSSLDSQIKTLGTEDLAQMGDVVVSILESKGVIVKKLGMKTNFKKLKKFREKGENFARKDYRKLKKQYGVDKIVVIDINAVGAYRGYSGYVPNGDPSGAVLGLAYIVDLNTNKYEMYEKIDVKVNAPGEWDEPPSFPGITNAYFQALELAKDRIKNMFK